MRFQDIWVVVVREGKELFWALVRALVALAIGIAILIVFGMF